MTLPSPSELCWVIGFSPRSRWIVPAVRAAVAIELDSARELARRCLGDERAASEILEAAIEHTAECLSGLEPVDVEETRNVLSRFYRNELRRRLRAQKKFKPLGNGIDVDSVFSNGDRAFARVEAQLDLESILGDTPEEVRAALLLRYGVRSEWEEVGKLLSKSGEAARKMCERRLKYLRKCLRIREQQSEQHCCRLRE